MNPDHKGKADDLSREMFVHINRLRTCCDKLLANKYPLDVWNEVHTLRSLVGQIDNAADRWREMS